MLFLHIRLKGILYFHSAVSMVKLVITSLSLQNLKTKETRRGKTKTEMASLIEIGTEKETEAEEIETGTGIVIGE